MKLKITVDGSCARRRMFVGIVIRNAETNEMLCLEHRYLGFGTNNQAEYLAIILACRTVDELYRGKVEEVSLYTDSQLAFNQLRGAYTVKNGKLRELHKRAINWMKTRIPVPVHLSWHSREDDDGPLADKLASAKYKEVMDENDHRVVKRGAGRDDSRKARGERVRAGGGGRDQMEDPARTAHRHPGSRQPRAAAGRTTRVGSTPKSARA